ncbi:hypothetical protein RHMOL_Rhmol04G0238000 [Rhododendron molle]|uniref:Uncharacterized protein n=1 Tax=Rhododendron molle TaxID=49168 RepID=A0ACC0P5E2_RHOML|nr:hypothetical protein RHMOL_Rhmol04G0238000 [Rhododendron molle]
MIRTQDSVHTVEDFLKQGSMHTEFGAEIASRISFIRDSGPSVEYISNPTDHDQKSRLIGELRDQIAKMKERMKQSEKIHSREIAIKDKKIESLDETVLVLLSENSQLWDQLTETAVHEVMQKYRPMTTEEQECSMITRLRARMRKDTQKEEYEYGRKHKRPTSNPSKVDAEVDPKGVIDVENFIAGPEKGPFKPKPIKNLRTNAVHRLLSSEEKANIKKMWDEAYTSTIIWSGTVVGCSVFVEDIWQLIVDSAISGNRELGLMPIVRQQNNCLDCGVIVCYIIRQYYRNEEIASILRKPACQKIRSEIVKTFLGGADLLWS